MATSSDPFDDDDDLFADPSALEAIEQSAILSSQAPKQRVTQPYHHTIAKPKAGPSRNVDAKPPVSTTDSLFSGRKAPQPINTEPRAGNTGFGWEHGGKRSMEGNVERHVDAVNKRQEYWSRNTMSFMPAQPIDEEEDYPDILMEDDGYQVNESANGGKKMEDQIQMVAASQARRSLGEAARRAAIASAGNKENTMDVDDTNVAGPSRLPGVSAIGNRGLVNIAPRFPGATRSLARSVSAGNHPINTTSLARSAPILPPISSQSSGSDRAPPASQGSAARKTALDLENERRQREMLEAEVDRLKAELDRKQAENHQASIRAALETAEKQAEETDDADLKVKVKDLQNQLWRAKGEAETMRRAAKDKDARSATEKDKDRARIAELEVKLREREKEAARQVENVKTQAVFANHAAHNSAMKARAASQRPLPTPLRNGSPRGKSDEYTVPTTIKGKGKAPPPPAPRFDSFKDAFTATPSVSRIKRPRLETLTPGPLSPNRRASPRSAQQQHHIGESSQSPTRKRHHDAGPSSPASANGDFGQHNDLMDIDAPLQVDVDIGETFSPPDHRAELLYHLFHYAYLSPFQASFDVYTLTRPVLYRILNYRPTDSFDTEGKYGSLCTELLGACGDVNMDYEAMLRILARCGVALLDMFVPMLEDPTPKLTHAEVSVLVNLLALLGKTSRLFPDFAPILITQEMSITALLRRLVYTVYFEPKSITVFDDIINKKPIEAPKETEAPNPYRTVVPAKPSHLKDNHVESLDSRRHVWSIELAQHASELCQGICINGGGPHNWNDDELVDITMALTAPHLNVSILESGIEAIAAAAIYRENFRALLTDAKTWPGERPILERISKLLINPPAKNDEDLSRQLVGRLITSLSMMSIAEEDAIILVADKSLVVPALIMLLQRESSKIWGVSIEEFDIEATVRIVQSALELLHYLILPINLPKSVTQPASADKMTPSASQRNKPPPHSLPGPDPVIDQSNPPQGINLIQRIRDISQYREYSGIGHQFISTFGALSYGSPISVVMEIERFDLDKIQNLSMDILELVVEGPEQDAVYEAYADLDDDEIQQDPADPGPAADGQKGKEKPGDGGEDAQDAVDMDVYDAMSVEDDDVEGDGRHWNTLLA